MSVATYRPPDPLVVETVDRLFGATCTFDAVEAADGDRWAGGVWEMLAGSAFPWVSIPEASGGSGGSLADAAAIIRSAGAHAAPVPISETGILGGWLLAGAGLPIPDGPTTVVPGSLAFVDGRVVGTAIVAWAEHARRIVGLVETPEGWVVAAARPDQVGIVPGANIAGEPRDTVTFEIAMSELESGPTPSGVDAEALVRRGSLSRIMLSAGALESMARLAVEYASTRRQFGKPIGSFQAVQHHLVIAGQCSVRASMAADLAVRASMASDPVRRAGSVGSTGFDLAAARVIVDDAAVLATRAVHQAHGAMGVTREYPLHHLSRRLWAWRHEYRAVAHWRRDLGRAVVEAGADNLFPLLTDSRV